MRPAGARLDIVRIAVRHGPDLGEEERNRHEQRDASETILEL